MEQRIRIARYYLVLLLFMVATLPSFSYSKSGNGWTATFGHTFQGNTGHSYGWWTGEGENAMYDRLCSVDISNGTSCTTAKPGFDIKVGVGAQQKKDFEYKSTSFDVYLVNSYGVRILIASGDITDYELQVDPL